MSASEIYCLTATGWAFPFLRSMKAKASLVNSSITLYAIKNINGPSHKCSAIAMEGLMIDSLSVSP